MNDIIKYKPIGYVRNEHSDEVVRTSWRGVKARIEVLPDYVEGLKGLEEFSHIIVVAHLHKAEGKDFRKVFKPKGFLKVGIKEEELPEVGVFCTASPLRPNPIAVTIMRLVKVEGNILYVDHCDLYDGTPVLDIKPMTPSRCPEEIKLPRWLVELREKALERSNVDIFRYG
ncbi:MAG: tRNA (N6-threonylcarbamoyladenosine(37)-N6)-methyltransferase TrmO [Desulfurococcales archaeon]|nr:tRNA (N6-threonylcarbamoyladenosine(37)-N6)-methyltransferase TrmO [Desulfurococcales archaeon]